MSERLRIGMIGCGEIGAQTARGIAESEFAEHAMVMDVSEGLARDLGETYGVPYTTRLDEILGNGRVDATYIAVPHHLHAPLTIQALRAGKHVLVEKPIAITLDDADQMIATARETGLTLSVAFHAQVDAPCQAVRTLIGDGAIGKIVGTRIVYRGDKPAGYWSAGYSGRVTSDWRTAKAKAGGGPLMMNTIHNLNTMRFVTGLAVTRVYAEYENYLTPVEVEDYAALTYRYANGAIGTLEAGSAIRGRDPLGEVDRVYGEVGQILLGRKPRMYLTRDAANFTAGAWQDVPYVIDERANERRSIVDGFAQSVLRGQPPPVRAEDGRAVLEVILAAYQAGRELRAINLPL